MTSDLNAVLEAGSLLMIETGECSDYSFHGPVKMLVTKTKQELADEFRAEWRFDPDCPWEEGPDPSDFLPWLIRKGYAEDHACHSWHVGSYGRFEP